MNGWKLFQMKTMANYHKQEHIKDYGEHGFFLDIKNLSHEEQSRINSAIMDMILQSNRRHAL